MGPKPSSTSQKWIVSVVLSNLAWALVFFLHMGSELQRPGARRLSAVAEPSRHLSFDTNTEAEIPNVTVPSAGDAVQLIPLTIPRILHQIYIGDSKHAGWRYEFWDQRRAEKFINKTDPSFFKDFSTYPRPVMQADAIRYYIMKHIGGLYLDGDTECWREGSDFLEGYDLVIQGHHSGEAAANGMMASIPGHPFWDLVIDMMKERRGKLKVVGVLEVLNSTGPVLVRDAILRWFNTSLGEDGHFRPIPKETRFAVHKLGTWYIPCVFIDKECIAKVMTQRALGRADLNKLAGMHHYSIGWSVPTGRVLNAEEKYKAAICNSTRQSR